MAVRIQLRNDTAANWTDADPVLGAGEFGLETDTIQFKIGDGTSTWTELDYGISGPTGPTGPSGGPTGPAGTAATIAVGTVSSTGPDGTPTVSNSGTSTAAVLDFILKQGPTGPAATIAVGTVSSTGPTGTATVTNSGTSSTAVFDFVLKQGDTGATGPSGDPKLTINPQTASYTAQLSDAGNLVEILSGSATNFTIPTDASVNFPIGTQISILQTGTGQVTVGAVTPGTTTVNATPGFKLRSQWSAATVIKRAANVWVATGDLAT